MQARINHTGRRKIVTKEVQFTLNEEADDSLTFDALFSLDKSKLPSDAKVYVEAYSTNTSQRFSFGTVANIQRPIDRRLDQIDLSSSILFRTHIIDESVHKGRLVASASEMRPQSEQDEDHASLLPVRQRNLGQQTWKIEFQTDSKPQLVINSRIPNAIGQVKHNREFQSLILPSAFRQVLMFFLWNHDEENEFIDEWIGFAEFIAGSKPHGEDAIDLMIWVDDVIAGFSDRFGLCDRLINSLKEGEQ